jgi:hypothetical protein
VIESQARERWAIVNEALSVRELHSLCMLLWQRLSLKEAKALKCTIAADEGCFNKHRISLNLLAAINSARLLRYTLVRFL